MEEGSTQMMLTTSSMQNAGRTVVEDMRGARWHQRPQYPSSHEGDTEEDIWQEKFWMDRDKDNNNYSTA